MFAYLRQSTASQGRMVGPFVDDTDFKSAKTGLTIANTDVQINVNGAAGVSKNSGGGTHRNNGFYSLTFDATDTATVGEFALSILVSSALVVTAKFWVLEEAIYDALFGASAAGFNASGQVVMASTATGAIVAGSFAAGAIDAAAIAADAIGSSELAASAVTEIQSGLSSLDAAGIRTALGLGSANLDTQLAAIQADTDNMQTRLPATLVSGRIDASVGAMAADVVTAAAIATDAIGSAELAASAVSEIAAAVTSGGVGFTVADIAAGVWNEALAGHVTAGTSGLALSTINAATDTEVAAILAAVDTEIAAIKAKTDLIPASPAAVGSAMTLTSGERDSIASALLKLDLSTVTGEATRSVLNGVRWLRNRFVVSGTALTVYKEDDTTPAWTGTVSKTAGDAPIREVDPA